MNMRTRIAKAVFNELARGNGTSGGKFWETAPKEVQGFCFSITDVVLVEMREPTSGMIAQADFMTPAGLHWGTDEGEHGNHIIWRGMIDAAKSEEE